MKTKYMIDGSIVNIFRMNEETALDELPPRVYNVCYDKFTGFYLEIIKDRLDVPEKIYGKTLERVEKCLISYKDRDTSTGILMTGDKGTGKSLLMSLLANAAIVELRLPILLINEPYNGSQFVSFIESIGECGLIFDEFGKMYSSNSRNENDVPQKALLTLMDGVDKTKRLIIMTENRESDISEFMLNRPSRIYYHFRYKKLDEESITGYCDDCGVDKSIVVDIIDVSRRSAIFSFDMLQSIVEEHLRFGSDIDDLTKELNIDLSEEFSSQLEILKIFKKGTEEEVELTSPKIINKPSNYNNSYLTIRKDVVRNGRDAESLSGFNDVTEEDSFTEIYLTESDLAYETKGQLIYELDEYTLIAKDVIKFSRDYFKMV